MHVQWRATPVELDAGWSTSVTTPSISVPASARAESDRHLELTEDVAQRPLCDRAPVIEQHRVVGEIQQLAERVRHVDDRDAELVAHLSQQLENLALAPEVECRERLVAQQQPRCRQQRTAECDALPLAARQLAGPALQQLPEPEHVDDSILRGSVGRRPATVRPQLCCVFEVAAHGQVRKQAAVLEHPADAASLHRQVDARRRVDEHAPVEHDAATNGRDVAGDQTQRRGLAAARWSKQRRDAGAAQVERGVERKVASSCAAVEFEQAMARAHAAQRRARRPSASESHSAPMAITSDRHASLRAACSPPGVCNAL